MNKLILIALSVLLSLPVVVQAVDGDISPEPIEVINTLDEDIELNTQEPSLKEPLSTKKIAKKFLAAMGGVAISSFAIFVMLSVYNQIREKHLCQNRISDGECSLESPNNLEDAVRTFLDKTKFQ